MQRIVKYALAGFFLALPAGARAQLSEKKSLTADGARRILAAVTAEAERRKTTGAIAIVDDGGSILSVERLDGTFPASAKISIGKAETAAMFRRPTKGFEELINKGRTAMAALKPAADFTPLQGGVPLVVDGQVVGAIGVSGAASAAEDEELANLGAEAAKGLARVCTAACGHAVAYVDGPRVHDAFEKGTPLLENAEYKIHASRRDAPGMAEVHTRDTDIIHVLEGSATIVTGGTVVDGKVTAADEIRGASITGGETRSLSRGDVIVVPANTPHWFKDVKGPLLYYVVKVTSCEGSKSS